MPSREPIQLPKRTLSESAAEALRQAILNGKLKPGEWLRQEALAEEMGISQMTVRDALNQLVGEGMAVRVPYKGVRVVSLDVEDVESICTMRGLLEGLAIELAAERITSEELDQMRKLLPETTPSAEIESVERARDVNREFHEIAIRASRQPFLIRLLKQLWDWLDPYVPYGGTSKMTERAQQGMLDDSERDLERHVRLLEALEARDGQRARRVVKQYMQEVWEGAKLYWQYTGMFPEYFDED